MIVLGKDIQRSDRLDKGVEHSVLVHHVTADFPTDKKFGSRSQMRRAAYSIPSNYAEGYGREGA